MAQCPVKILTFHCNGLNGKIKTKWILTFLQKSQADIMFLQETHCRYADRPIFNSKCFSSQLLAAGTSKSRGEAIILSTKLRSAVTEVKRDPMGCYIFANISLEGETLTLASLYVPNDKPVKFLSESLEVFWAFNNSPILVGGDLNCFSDTQLDYSGVKLLKGGKGNHRGTLGNLQSILDRNNMMDLWRYQY